MKKLTNTKILSSMTKDWKKRQGIQARKGFQPQSRGLLLCDLANTIAGCTGKSNDRQLSTFC